jgi:hypothetical protein
VTERIFITPPDGTNPPIGFFAVKLMKGGLERAVRVEHNDDQWTLSIDGVEHGKSVSWKVAFGEYAARTYFIGRPISADEYLGLIKRRRHDIAGGLDIDEPIDINQIRARRF